MHISMSSMHIHSSTYLCHLQPDANSASGAGGSHRLRGAHEVLRGGPPGRPCATHQASGRARGAPAATELSRHEESISSCLSLLNTIQRLRIPLDPSDPLDSLLSPQIGEQLEALYDQYDAEDFELGIKQFMIEQAIQQVRAEICIMASKLSYFKYGICMRRWENHSYRI